MAKQKGKLASGSQASNHTLDWWDNDSDSDFQMSDNASDDSDTEGVGLNTAMFISGPTGVGKTAMVYACAEELGYKVCPVMSLAHFLSCCLGSRFRFKLKAEPLGPNFFAIMSFVLLSSSSLSCCAQTCHRRLKATDVAVVHMYHNAHKS